MLENLNIEVLIKDKTATLELSGRLDANWAGHLDENIEKIIRSGIYDVILDTKGIIYISSAGIRILVKQYKNLQSIGGNLSISHFSEQVKEVLNMVGMVPMFSQKETTESTTSNLSTEAWIAHGYRFMPTTENEKSTMKVSFSGNPEGIYNGSFNKSDNITFEEHKYAVGIGAIGNDFNDCKERFGEFLSMGDAVAYMPSDKNGIPDYTLKTGQLIPEIQSLYAVLMKGLFSTRYRFTSDGDQSTIGLSQILEAVQDHQVRDTVAFLMIAESGGLVGTTLNNSPVKGEDPFEFPQIRDRVSFTTEPAYDRMLTVSVGIITKTDSGEILQFTRPLQKDSPLKGHIHTAVFPYQTLKKRELNMQQTIHQLLEESIIKDIMHLTNDSREITGLGESQFIQGYIWCAPANL